MRYAVNQRIPKVDAEAMVAGRPVYTEDIAPADGLVVKVLRSQHAHARVLALDKSRALEVPGVACVLDWQDVPRIRHTLGGYVYRFGSPFDRCILDDTVRYVGDAVAIVAAESEEAAEKALRRLRPQFEVLPAVFDARRALGHQPPIHAEADYTADEALGGQVQQNLAAHFEMGGQGLSEAFNGCEVVLEETFHTRANAHCMMETFRTATYYDAEGKLCILTSTQIPFLVLRTAAHALGLPVHRVRVIKPKVGGGFGAKQSLVSELLCAVVTWKTGRPARLMFTRGEAFTASNSRHEMHITVRMGATRDGVVRAIDVYSLCNAGAYGEQSFPTALLSGVKTIPLFAKAAFRFRFDIVYTNTMAGGAFRGFGATQGFFATENMANRMAAALGMDPAELRLHNIPRSGDFMPAYMGEFLTSSALERCIHTGKQMIGWDKKYPRVPVGGGRVRAVGMALAMQSSGVSGADKCCAAVRLNDDGSYTVYNGAGDRGTGCDTILLQIAAETLQCAPERISVAGVDTDTSPYDKGSYASSTTYVTGMAMVKACRALRRRIVAEAAGALGLPARALAFDGERVYQVGKGAVGISLAEVAKRQITQPESGWLRAEGSHCSPASPPPLMAGFVEIELDTDTGRVEVLDFVGVVDCGTVINPALARVQAQGGIAQGIGMALFEDVRYSSTGAMACASFLQYKIPTRLDLPEIRVAFEESYEPSGPYGAKSIGEVVINTPAPAIADAIRNACGACLNELPMTPEKILRAMGKL